METKLEKIIKDYEITLEEFHEGLIDYPTWYEYCEEILAEIMEENKEILEKLKNRG